VAAAGSRTRQRHITPLNPRFTFYHADCFNASYNPGGAMAPTAYRFPHGGESFDLIVLTSVLTHLVPDELEHYLSEVDRLLAPDGAVYASMFLYGNPEQVTTGTALHGVEFPVVCGHYSVNRADFPANAVAYDETFAGDLIGKVGLKLLGPPRYGTQDLLVLTRQSCVAEPVKLDEGWYELECDCWRWTQRCFTVDASRPSSPAPTLQFRFTALAALLEETGVLRLRAAVNGVSLPVRDVTVCGEHLYRESIQPRTPGNWEYRSSLEPRAIKLSGLCIQ
jgi:SAM-dependent methyltransferase